MGNSKRRVSFYTLGCRLNQAETALIENSFRHSGYDVVAFGEVSDVFVLNSCTVTGEAEAECRKLIRRVLRQNAHTYVAVIGCYAQTGAVSLQNMEGVDLIVGTQDKLRIAEMLREPVKTGTPQILLAQMERTPFTIETFGAYVPTTRANLKIQEGCNFMCSYCIVPFARGRARSRDFEDIRREAQQLLAAGYQELVLTGVNIGMYRFADKTLVDVVEMLLSLEGTHRVRISSIEPTTIPERILELMVNSSSLCPHLHIPLQSGCDRVLRNMHRQYTSREYLDFVELAAARVPGIMLAADIIVGFPGEDDTDFDETCQLFADSPLVYAHIFPFSERQGTAAARLANKISPVIKKARSQKLHAVSEAKKRQFYLKLVGQTVRVLTEEQDEHGRWTGFTDNYVKVAIADSKLSRNQLLQVRITHLEQEVAVGNSL